VLLFQPTLVSAFKPAETAQTGTVCQYYSVALHIFFVHCHIFVDLCHITLGQALAHRSRMSLRRFCQPVCHSIKEAIPFEAISLNAVVCGMLLLQWVRLGPEFDKYLLECLYLFCEKDDDPPKSDLRFR
jgi:hypothetical protein